MRPFLLPSRERPGVSQGGPDSGIIFERRVSRTVYSGQWTSRVRRERGRLRRQQREERKHIATGQ